MIKAGTKVITDSGFAVVTETVGGVARQALVLELPDGISEEEIAALCAGPVQVVDEEGNILQSHTGPFRVATHGMKLVRTNASGDVAALTARVGQLEAELDVQVSAKESALSQLASVTAQLTTLQTTIQEAAGNEEATGTPVVTTPIQGGGVSTGTQVSTGAQMAAGTAGEP